MTNDDEPINSDSVPSAHVDVVTAVLDGDAVAYHVGTATPTLLNSTATAVWLLIDDERSVGEICSVLASTYGTDEKEILPDLLALLAEFRTIGLTDRVVRLKS